MKTQVLVVLAIVLMGASVAQSAEIRLKSNVSLSNAIVRLGQIAEIEADAAERYRLEKLELFPAPLSGSTQFSASQVREWMTLRGVRMDAISFAGATRVRITRTEQESVHKRSTVSIPPAFASQSRLSMALAKQAVRRVEAAIVKHLETTVQTEMAWQVSAQINKDYLAAIPGRVALFRIRGGRAPYTGSQAFFVEFDRDNKRYSIPVSAVVKLPPLVVVTTQRLARGAILRSRDVELKRIPSGRNNAAFDNYTSIDQVVGLETTRSFAEGQAVTKKDLRKQIIVQRRKVVKVVARAGGVRINTYGKSLEEGGLDDVIRVQPLKSRNSRDFFVARVTGIDEVELFTSGPKYESKNASVPPVNNATTRPAEPAVIPEPRRIPFIPQSRSAQATVFPTRTR